MVCNAEIDAVLSVLWNSFAVRGFYEDRALRQDETKWKNNGDIFSNLSRYHSEKWKRMMGPDDPTVRGRRISSAAMAQARSDFENSYREPVFFALALADRVRAAVATATGRQGGPLEEREYEEEVGRKAWNELRSDRSVKEQLVQLAQHSSNVDASSVQMWPR